MILRGDCLELLKTLDAGIVQTCVTSPPYYGLRDYGVAGQIGLEESPEAYVEKLVAVFREVRRVLKDDGTIWLNLGDSYWGGKGSNACNDTHIEDRIAEGRTLQRPQTRIQGMKVIPTNGNHPTLKPKDLIMIPAKVAIALQEDGWYLRSDIIWHKPNPMPESVTDRPTKSHEYIFLLSKNAQYYYDAEAIQEVATGYDGRKDSQFKGAVKNYSLACPGQKPQTFAQRGHERWKYKNLQEDGQQPNSMHLKRLVGDEYMSPVRNKRSVWTVNTKPYKEAHFATFPPDLIKPCILAGCPPGGIVLDPFFGSGTTGAVAKELGRDFIGLELNPKYIELAEKRIAAVNPPLFTENL